MDTNKWMYRTRRTCAHQTCWHGKCLAEPLSTMDKYNIKVDFGITSHALRVCLKSQSLHWHRSSMDKYTYIYIYVLNVFHIFSFACFAIYSANRFKSNVLIRGVVPSVTHFFLLATRSHPTHFGPQSEGEHLWVVQGFIRVDQRKAPAFTLIY